MQQKGGLQYLAFALSVSLSFPLLAETIDYKQMEQSIRSGDCPTRQTDVAIESKPDRCGGDGTNSPCGSGLNFNKACSDTYTACGNKWVEDRNTVNAYNALIAKCKSKTKQSNDSPSKFNGSRTTPMNIGDRLKDREKKAEQAPAKAQAYKMQVEQDEAKTINKRDHELEAARKDVADRKQRDRENRAAEKAKAEAEERQKWHCFGDRGNFRAGFRQCMGECSAYFPESHCHETCYASGDGSVSNGRSCYREP